MLSMSGLFPDAAILLGVEDTDIVDRLLPGKLEKWKVKRDKRLAEKAKRKAIASKAKVNYLDHNNIPTFLKFSSQDWICIRDNRRHLPGFGNYPTS